MKTNTIFIILLLISCNKNDDKETNNNTRDLIFLKVDFQTNNFKGANVFQFNNIQFTSNIPFEANYIPPNNFFGNYTLKYIPTEEIVFDGTIRWLGFTYDYPVTSSANTFLTTNQNAIIDFSTAEYFLPTINELNAEGYNTNFNYQEIWDAVKNLEITNQYVSQNAKIGFLLYTPGLGIFQPDSACWFVILYK